MAKKIKKAAAVEAIRHRDKRKNIPTEELRGFVTDEELAPKTMLYPRDPSLDPQLVWKGKDEQDRADLAVPVVPIYIQEKVHPRAIIDGLLADRRGKPGGSPEQLDLFSDFNGLPDEFDQRIEFYRHDAHWSNRMILGDSLLVMTSLAEKEGLKGKVQTIYIDPPYGIKFGSNWQVSTRKRDVKDGKAEDATRQPEQVRAFRDTWKLGIHSYLAYLRDRLVVARELLTETGSVFVQIGDENVHLVRCVMDEVFGGENIVAQISFETTANIVGNYLGSNTNYLLWYAKEIENLKYRQLYEERTFADDVGGRYTRVELSDGTRRVMSRDERDDLEMLPQGARIYRHDNLASQGPTASGTVWFEFEGKKFHPGASSHWKTTVDGLQRLATARRLAAPTPNSLTYVRYLDDFPVAERTNVWTDTQTGAFTEEKVYVVQTNSKVIERCLLMTTDPGDLVLDPTCGSGTTAYVAEQWGRRWITCDTSRVALALARTRLMAAKFPYYYLADDYPQIGPNAADEEIKKTLRASAPLCLNPPDIRKGFIYRRVPHVTLKSIANNPDIKEGISRAEIDAAIARHAETETLFDQPYEDKSRVRVSGPFTVESLSPHRTISVEQKQQRSEYWDHGRNRRVVGPNDFGQMIIDNLRKAGVQNTRRKERLVFDSIHPYPGEWIHAEGFYTEYPSTEYSVRSTEKEGGAGGGTAEVLSTGVPSTAASRQRDVSPLPPEPIQRRAAICIGPEHGTAGAELIKQAAKEAVKGVGFDILIVCGFAFDPSVSEETKRYGKLTVLAARINPDLAMGDELLKKTGAGNLFTVFGEPDIEVRPQKDGRLVVEIKGLDVYDPTTGEIRSSSTDDIACWFIDTNYNEESFFVRHAYFTGADEPYEKLKRALRAEVDEGAWSSLYSTTSRPFERPETGKIAVKVINHYGDEVLRMFGV